MKSEVCWLRSFESENINIYKTLEMKYIISITTLLLAPIFR